MATSTAKVLYTGCTHATGGRDGGGGATRSSDGFVTVSDVTAVIAAFGPCP